MINCADVQCVYSGKSNTCYCGCAGTYKYHPDHVQSASKRRGYEVTSEEVDFKAVKRIVNKLNKNWDKVENQDDKIFTLRVGNHDYTVYLDETVLEERAKVVATEESNEKYRKDLSHEIVRIFNDKHRGSLVYLELVEDSNAAAFQIHFNLEDPFINQEIYVKGNAVIYPSPLLYQEIQRIAGDAQVKWNNTQTIGWIAY